MNEDQLSELGFKNTSYEEEGIFFREFLIEKGVVKIEIDGDNSVEIAIDNNWHSLPNCQTIEDLKELMRLFDI